MSIVSTLEQARDGLALPADTPAAEVLATARARHTQYETDSNNLRLPAVRRNGVKRQLTLLAPMLPVLEMESELAELEAGAAAPGPRIHQLRLERNKLATRVAGLPPGDERTIFEARLQDVVEALEQPKKNREIESELAELEAGAAAPGPRLPQLRLECNQLAIRVAGLTSGEEHAAFAARLKAVSETLNAKIAQLELEAAIARMETDAIAPDTKPDRLRAELDQITARAIALPKGGERAEAEARIKRISSALVAREQVAAIAATLALFEASVAAPDAKIDQLRSEVEPLGGRIAGLSEGGDRTGFEARLKKAAETLTTRKQMQEVGAALTALEGRAAAPDAKPDVLRTELDLFAPRLAALPAGRPRTEFESRLKIVSDRLSTLVAAKKAAAQRAIPPQTGEVLKLLPIAGGPGNKTALKPLHFIARPRFVIGRFAVNGPSVADFSCPLAEKRVGRVHVVLQRKGGKFLIQDGDGTRKSTNGARLDDEPLSATAAPASFAAERSLVLGEAYTVLLRHLPGEAPSGPVFPEAKLQDTGSKTVALSVLSGSMRFTPKSEGTLPATVVWIFTDATIGSTATHTITLPPPSLGDAQGRIHHWQNSFWIENLGPAQSVRVTAPAHAPIPGERPLAKGDIVSLRSGDILRLGQLNYEVTVEN